MNRKANGKRLGRFFFLTHASILHQKRMHIKRGIPPPSRHHKEEPFISALKGRGFLARSGKLPRESYGAYGPGRYRPNEITWVGAPALSALEIGGCLRSRYKDSIVQALPKDSLDQGAIIRPIPLRAKAFRLAATGVELVLVNKDVISGDIVFDCTNQTRPSYGPAAIDARKDPNIQSAVFKVGPGAKSPLPQKIREVIDRLGIRANTTSLWALMDLTDRTARRAGELAVLNAILRDGDVPL